MKKETCMLAIAGDEKKIKEMVNSGRYAWEVKWDGERCIIDTRITEVGDCTLLLNRNGNSMCKQFPEIKERVYKTDSDSAVCASIIESYLNQQGYTRIKLEEKARK